MLYKINGYEFELNMLDYETALRIENECEKIQHTTKDIADRAGKGGMRQSELILEATTAVSNFFDTVAGEGTGQKILKGQIDYGLALKCFGDFIIQKNHSGNDIRDINNEYMPKIKATLPNGGNREQRRAGNKGKGNKHPNKRQYK